VLVGLVGMESVHTVTLDFQGRARDRGAETPGAPLA